MKTILITGGSGLVGNALKTISNNYDYKFIFLSSADCDLTSYSCTLCTFSTYNPDYVIHLAACVGGLFKNMAYKVDMYEKNILINLNVLKVCHEIKVKKLISCLSTCIFPDKTTNNNDTLKGLKINETMLHDGPPHTSNDAYAYAKRMLEVHSRAYQEQYGDNFICVIPTNIYGPHDNFHLKDSHVIPGLIHKCYLAKKENKPFVVAGSGTPLRQFIYSEDLAILILWTLENYDEKEPIILSVPENLEKSINFIATCIAREFNYENNIEFDTDKPDGQFKKTADNSKLMSFIKSFHFTPIEEGITKTVDWFVNNYNHSRK
jgi:GDP-L-fucose synthase